MMAVVPILLPPGQKLNKAIMMITTMTEQRDTIDTIITANVLEFVKDFMLLAHNHNQMRDHNQLPLRA